MTSLLSTEWFNIFVQKKIMRADYHGLDKHEIIIKYYSTKIKKGMSYSMWGLGSYYQHIGDIVNMLKWFIRDIKKGSRDAMLSLGHYYYKINDDTNAVKYYLMAIEKGHIPAAYSLKNYLINRNFNYNLCKCLLKYYPDDKLESTLDNIHTRTDLLLFVGLPKDLILIICTMSCDLSN